MNQATQEAIVRHGELVKARFDLAATVDPVALCKKLRRLEVAAHRNAEAYCNGAIDGDTYALRATDACEKLVVILGPTYAADLIINSDPRGYALKCEPAGDLPRDWGGYGLIAPDLSRRVYHA
jgi:hypothetical protein